MHVHNYEHKKKKRNSVNEKINSINKEGKKRN